MSGLDTEVTEARAAVATLLADNDDTGVWSALRRDGWLDTYARTDGAWPSAAAAMAVTDAVGRSDRTMPVGAHLGAASALAAAGDARCDEASIGVLVDTRMSARGRLTGRLWGGADGTVVVSCPDGSVSTTDGSRCVTADDPLAVLGPAVVRGEVERSSLQKLTAEPEACARHRARLAYLIAVETIAGASAVTSATLVHVGERRQFGHTLGSFQALQHRAVDMHMAVAMGESLVRRATQAWCAGDALGAAWQAKLFAATRGVWAAEQAIQLHGAIGCTWELGLHRTVRRAQRARVLLGGASAAAAEVLSHHPVLEVDGLTDWSLV